jgi:hypothetical protein
MLEFELLADPSHQLFVVSTNAHDALPVAVSLHSLGATGPYQVRAGRPAPHARACPMLAICA